MSEFISPNVTRIPPYVLTKIWEVNREVRATGADIIDLATGVPEVDPPKHVIDATVEAVRKPTFLSPPEGLPELKAAIVDRLFQDDGSIVKPSEILITPGSKCALFVSILSSINAGDEVIVLSPYFHPYLQITGFAGGNIVTLSCASGGSIKLDPNELERKITKKTKLIILNYPNNPAGWTLSRDELKRVVDIAQAHNLLLITDEIYDRMVFDGMKHHHSTSFPDMQARIMMMGSFSKTYAMPHYRLGYLVAEEKRIQQIRKLLLAMITMPNTFVQWAGVAALRGPQDFVEERLRTYDKRRKRALEKLNHIDGVHCLNPQGGFYVFPDFSILNLPSIELAQRLIREVHVAADPGIGSGLEWDHYLRISLTDTDERIDLALDRIAEFVQKNRRR